MAERTLAALLKLLHAAAARDVTIKRLAEPRSNGDCVAVCDAEGLLVTKAEATTLVKAGARDEREPSPTTPRRVVRRRRDYAVRVW